MLSRTKYIVSTLFVAIWFAGSSLAYAKGILEIVPSSTTARSITLAAAGSTTLTYSVTNNAKITANNITIDPYFNMPSHPLTLTVQNNNCASNLVSGSTCTFELLVQGNGQSVRVVLMPMVCEFNGAICSVPIQNNRITIATGTIG